MPIGPGPGEELVLGQGRIGGRKVEQPPNPDLHQHQPYCRGTGRDLGQTSKLCSSEGTPRTTSRHWIGLSSSSSKKRGSLESGAAL